jgi:2-oxoisovalerate ferredoxin oxidoreductase beta subunit
VANAGALAGRFTTWYPTYGPEQRGGAASCSLVLAGQPVGAPSVDHPDVLVCMTPPMLKRFLPSVKPGGTVFCDSLVLDAGAPRRPDVRLVSIPATELAAAAGYARAGNTAILAAMAHTGVTGLPDAAIGEARDLSLRKKPALVELNRKLYDSALTWCRENL